MMKALLIALPILALAACSQGEDAASPEPGAKPLCTAEDAGAATAAKAAELLAATRTTKKADREAACTRFADVIDDGTKAGIADAATCRWDNRNSNGNPRFLVSLHLTQLKGQARKVCGNLD